jgi:hypothetical protein
MTKKQLNSEANETLIDRNTLFVIYKIFGAPKRYCPAGTKLGQNWYQLNHNENLYCRQVSFTMPQGTPSGEEHKHTWRL